MLNYVQFLIPILKFIYTLKNIKRKRKKFTESKFTLRLKVHSTLAFSVAVTNVRSDKCQ